MSSGLREPVSVLVVDDEPGYAEVVSEFLQRNSEGLEATPVTSGRAALSALDGASFDCVVSDFDMPGMDGLELLAAVSDRFPDLPFILFTGRGSEEVASDAISAGVTDYFQKEAGIEQYEVLANRIEHAVDRRRAEGRLAESQRRFHRLLRNLPGMVYRCRNERGWPMVSASAYCDRLTGHDASALEDGTVSFGFDVIHPADREPVWDAVQAAVEDDEPFLLEYRIETAEGEEKRVWEKGQAIEGVAEEPLLEGFITDLSEYVYAPNRDDETPVPDP